MNFNEKVENSDLFLKVIQNVPIGIIIFSSDWKITFVNENFYQFGSLYQINTDSLIGNSILEFQIFPAKSISSDLKRLQEGFSFEFEIEDIKTIDAKISVVVKASPLFDNGIFSGGVLIVEDLKVAEKQTRDNELSLENFEKALGRLNNFLFVTDQDGIVKFAFGKEIGKLDISSGLNEIYIGRIFHQKFQADFKEVFDSAKEKRITEKTSIGLLIDEEVHQYNCIIEPLVKPNGKIQFIFIWLNEISELIRNEKNLQKELNKLKQYEYVINSSVDAIFIMDENGLINFWTDSAGQMFGYFKEEITGEFIGSLLKDFDQNNFTYLKEKLKNFTIWEDELYAKTKSGKDKLLYSRFTLIDNSDNNIVVVCSDITEKRGEIDRLKYSEEKFKRTFQSSNLPACILNPDGYISDINRKFAEELKYHESELLNKNIRNLIFPDFIKETSFDLKSYFGIPEFSIPFTTGEGEKIIFSSSIIPFHTDKNKLKYIICYFKNITTESVTEEEIKFFSLVFQSSPEGIAVEYNDRIIHVNETFVNIFGYERANEITGKDLFDLIISSDIIRTAEYLRLVEKKRDISDRIELNGKRKDNSNFICEMSASAFEYNSKQFKIIIVRDITEKKKIQHAITDSEERYRTITENIDGFLYTYERLNNILSPVFFTSSVEKITGYTRRDFLTDSKLLIKIVHPDDLPSLKQKIRILLGNRIQTSDELEFRLINKAGNIVWVRNKVNIIKGFDGKTERIYGLINDISARKKTEEELIKSTENLVKLNETKDKFISIVSHDLRTPFSSILGFTDLLLNDEGLTDEEKHQYIKYIRDSSKSMLSLVNSLLDWTRLQTGRIKFELEKIDAQSIIEKSLTALSGTAFQKNIELVSIVKNDVFIFVDRELIGQVFNNLISNAIKFTKEGGHVIISSRPSDTARFIEFSVKDNGVGIKPENLKYLFKVESKFTSEGTLGEKGSGLGLSLVKEIIEKHGGKIWVDTEYGAGSEFKFTLPVASADILFVDDNNTDKLLYSKILKNITPDYNIEVASNGKDALERIKNSPPALIITDHTMPLMDGYELVQNLKNLNMKNKPPVIILSGNIERNEIDNYHRQGIEFVFQKPVNLSLFKLAVEKCLKQGLK